MRLKRIVAVPLTLFATIALAIGTARAQVTSLEVHSFLPEGLHGYVTHDLLLNFEGQYTGSQMILTLESGSIFQHESRFAGDLAPAGAAIAVDPTLAFDTFLANGGPTAADNASAYQRGNGAAINVDETRGHPLGTLRPGAFSTDDIDTRWNPAGGFIVQSDVPFLVARVTLSSDARGTLQYIASAGPVGGTKIISVPTVISTGLGAGMLPGEEVPGAAQGNFRAAVPIINGVVTTIPEPSSIVLLVVATAGLAALIRGRGARRATEYVMRLMH